MIDDVERHRWQTALANMLLGFPTVHAPDRRGRVVVVPGRVPVHDRTADGQERVGLPCAVIVLNVVEQRRDIAAPDAEESSPGPKGENVKLQEPGDLLLGAQAVLRYFATAGSSNCQDRSSRNFFKLAKPSQELMSMSRTKMSVAWPVGTPMIASRKTAHRTRAPYSRLVSASGPVP
jgi:hypothetical protein